MNYLRFSNPIGYRICTTSRRGDKQVKSNIHSTYSPVFADNPVSENVLFLLSINIFILKH